MVGASEADADYSLSALPEELQARVLSFLPSAADLGRASSVTATWRDMAQECAEQRACAAALMPYRGRSAQPGATGPSWVRILHTCEALEEAVGQPPAHSWKEEWFPLQLQSLRLRATAAGPEAEASLNTMLLDPGVLAEVSRSWQPGGGSDVESFLRDNSAASVGWKLAQGWPHARAQAYTLLASSCKAVLGHAVRSRLPAFAASTHLLCRALGECAWLARPAPDAYKDLGGAYGLCKHDPAWAALDTAAPPAIGTSFVSSAMLEASASRACLSAEGFCTPVHVGNDGIEYQPQPSAVVRFRSAATDRFGFHSLLPTALTEDETEYDLPPLSTVTLQRVDAPGSWLAYGVTVNQRLLTVSVSFALP